MSISTSMITVSYNYNFKNETPIDSREFETWPSAIAYYGSDWDNVEYINCDHCDLDYLPVLPKNLRILYCNNNKLIELPELPPNIRCVYCSNNKITSFPVLHEGIISYHGSGNNYKKIDGLPKSLIALSISNLNIEYIQDLSGLTNLIFLQINNSGLTVMPYLPNSLKFLLCRNNMLTELVNLPKTLKMIRAENNLLAKLELPDDIESLHVVGNQLKTMPPIPKCIKYLAFGDNPLINPIRIYETRIIVRGCHFMEYKTGKCVLSYGNEPYTREIDKLKIQRTYFVNELKQCLKKNINFKKPRSKYGKKRRAKTRAMKAFRVADGKIVSKYMKHIREIDNIYNSLIQKGI